MNLPASTNEPEFPDISEMFDAIRLAEAALAETGMLSAQFIRAAPLETLGNIDRRRRDALAGCRAVIEQYDAAVAAFDPSATEERHDAH